MTQPKWTKEPWRAHLNVPNAAIEGHIIKAAHGAETPIASLWVGGGLRGKPTQKANALRIVSCVNFLAGIEDLSDKTVVTKEFVAAAKDLLAQVKSLRSLLRNPLIDKETKEGIVEGLNDPITRAEKAFGGSNA